MSIRATFSLVALAVSLALQSGAAWADLRVQNAWVRGTTPTQKASGAFMSITSSETATLIAATSPIAGRIELHEMLTSGGMMRMRRVEKIDLPANKAVDLGPGGYHVMMMELKQQLVEGTTIPLILTVSTRDGRRSDVRVQVSVAAITAQAGPADHGHH